jgi:hypothetical protein
MDKKSRKEKIDYAFMSLLPQLVNRVQEGVVQYYAGARPEITHSYFLQAQAAINTLVELFEPKKIEE